MNTLTIKGASRVLTTIAFIFTLAAWSNEAAAQNVLINPPATFTVDRTDDATVSACTTAANDCTLRGAIAAANNAPGSTVNFDATVFASTQTINLANGQLTVSKDMTITGTGADKLTVRNTAAASSTSRVFNISAGTVGLSGMTITGGNTTSSGGGILNNGTTTVTNCVIDGNTASGTGGGIEKGTGSLTVIGSTVSNNTAGGAGGGGGGIDGFGGTLTITNSTVSGNKITSTSNNNGGGIFAANVTMTLTNSTITNNSVGGTSGASGIYSGGSTVTTKNTIVAGNVNNANVPDITGAFTSSGNNLIGNKGTATGFTNGVNGDQVGDSTTPLDPRLAPLGSYGGGTLTHALLNVSTAIDAGNTAGAPTSDQRGAPRQGNSDIGAYEINGSFTGQLASATQGQPYSQTLVADTTLNGTAFSVCYYGSPSSYGLTVTGAAPCVVAGIAEQPAKYKPTAEAQFAALLAPTAAVTISGTPTANGTLNFTLQLTGSGGSTNVPLALPINPPAAPTAALVTVSGRVTSALTGRGINRAVVSMIGADGITRRAATNSFGYYRFADVPAGETYIFNIKVKSRQYEFAARVVTVNEDIDDLNFAGN